MRRQQHLTHVTIVKLSKSGGVVVREPSLRKATRTARVREYFYGPRNDLQPHSQTVAFRDLAVFRIGGGPQAPNSALPIGEPANCALWAVFDVLQGFADKQRTCMHFSICCLPDPAGCLHIAGCWHAMSACSVQHQSLAQHQEGRSSRLEHSECKILPTQAASCTGIYV